MTHINQRRDTAANWIAADPVLQLGEVGWETDTRKSKLGDGVTAWSGLLYTVSTVVVTAADIGLGNVDNTSDLDKPVSTATQAEIDSRIINSIADADTTHAPSRNAVFDALAAKADLASPALTGTPTAPTPATSDDDTSIATTEFVHNVVDAVAVPDVQVFTAGGTWNKPAGGKYIVIEVVGGGGGGGGSSTTDGTSGAGGGGGGFAKKQIAAGAAAATETVTVGAAGAAGSAAGGTGGTGGTSSFGAHVSATGGVGGASRSGTTQAIDGGAGGAGASGDLNLSGENGGTSYNTSASAHVHGGAGGSSQRGAGASALDVTAGGSAAGHAGKNYGGGGGGACTQGGGSGQAGGAGAPGLVIVTTYFA